MATKKTNAGLNLFDSRQGDNSETRVWEFPAKFDWAVAKAGDLVQFASVRNWDSPANEPVYVAAVGRIRAKGKTDGDEKRYVQVEIIWDEDIPRLRPDLRTFMLDR